MRYFVWPGAIVFSLAVWRASIEYVPDAIVVGLVVSGMLVLTREDDYLAPMRLVSAPWWRRLYAWLKSPARPRETVFCVLCEKEHIPLPGVDLSTYTNTPPLRFDDLNGLLAQIRVQAKMMEAGVIVIQPGPLEKKK